MKKISLIIAFFAIIAFGLAMPLGAQQVIDDLGGLQSNTNMATAGLFTNDVDDYMSVHDYANVLSEDTKWFGFITGRDIAGGALDIGYARNFGGIYLGAWFRGNIFRSTNAAVTKSIIPVYDPTYDFLTQTTDRIEYPEGFNETTNNIEFLIGLKGMGIKVGFFESTSSNKYDGPAGVQIDVVDTLDGIKTYINAVDAYTNTASYLKPYAGWGGAFNVAGMKISPYVNLGLLIYDKSAINNYSSYTIVGGVKQDVQNFIGKGQNNGYMQPQATLGAWLDLPKKENSVQMSVCLEYGLSLNLYNSSAEGLGSVDGTVSWGANDGSQYINKVTNYADRTETNTDITYTINEQTYISHIITPAFKVTGEPAENFKLGFGASLPISISSSSVDNYSRNIKKDTVKYNNGLPGYVRNYEFLSYDNGGHSETSYLDVTLNLAIGASYQLIPGRFGINAGIAASPVRYIQSIEKILPRTTDSIETNKITQDDGSVTTNDKIVIIRDEPDQVTETSYFSQYTGSLFGGFTFNFNEKAALDLGVESDVANSFRLDITTVNVIFTFKF